MNLLEIIGALCIIATCTVLATATWMSIHREREDEHTYARDFKPVLIRPTRPRRIITPELAAIYAAERKTRGATPKDERLSRSQSTGHGRQSATTWNVTPPRQVIQ